MFVFSKAAFIFVAKGQEFEIEALEAYKYVAVAEWLGKGSLNLVQRFESVPRRKTIFHHKLIVMALHIGEIAPDFKAESTQEITSFYRYIQNHWAILFSHPSDFTPVCTSELAAVAKLKEEFDKRNTKVLGISIGSLESHQRWIYDIVEAQQIPANYYRFSGDCRSAPGGGKFIRYDSSILQPLRHGSFGFYYWTR